MIKFSREVVKLANTRDYRSIYQQCLDAISESRLEHFVDIISSIDIKDAGVLQFTQGYDGNTLIHSLSSGVAVDSISYMEEYDRRLDFQLNIHHPNRIGLFPCHIAVDYSQLDILEHLHKYGSNFKQNVLFTKDGQAKHNVYTYAAQYGNFTVLEKLHALRENIDTPNGSERSIDFYLKQVLPEHEIIAWRSKTIIDDFTKDIAEDDIDRNRNRVLAKLI